MADVPSRRPHDRFWPIEYLAALNAAHHERRRELVTGAQIEGATPRDAAIVADACIEAARRIMIELLALRAGPPQGRA